MSNASAGAPSFTGSSILRESPPFPSSSRAGPWGADLSLSEFDISDAPKPFSLLAQRDGNQEPPRDEGRNEHEVDEGDVTMRDIGKSSVNAARTREERLQHDLFVLKKLNSSFAAYNDALQDTMSGTESVAVQLERTDRLLDQYVSLLQHTEKNSKLIFDETWEGGGTDQEILEKMRVEAEERAKREREERDRAAQLERQRREEEERKAKQEKESREKNARASVAGRGVRGVRGLKARGSERGASTAARASSTSTTQAKRGVSSTRSVQKS